VTFGGRGESKVSDVVRDYGESAGYMFHLIDLMSPMIFFVTNSVWSRS